MEPQKNLFFKAVTGTFTSEPIDTSQSNAVCITWLARWSVPFEWHKSPLNPVIPGKPTVPSIVQVGQAYRLYFGQRPQGISFATADQPSSNAWQISPNLALGDGEADSFAGGGVNAPCVVKISETHWRMYYVGYHPTLKTDNTPVHQVGVAESLDAGITWKHLSKNPAIPRGEPGTYDGFSTSSVSVIKHNNTWHLYYSGIAQVPYRVSICLATSNDGVNFTKHPQNPVLPYDPNIPGQEHVCAKPNIHYINGLFRMWYTIRAAPSQTNNPASNPAPHYRIAYAESHDGVHFERWPHNPILNPSPTGWDDQMVGYSELLIDNDHYHMWYCGNNYQSIGYAYGQTTQPAVWLREKTRDNWTDWQPCMTGQTIHTAGKQIQLRAEAKTPAYLQNLTLLATPGE